MQKTDGKFRLFLLINKTVLQGILGMLSAINGEQFFLECYTPLGEVIFILTFQPDIFKNYIFGQNFTLIIPLNIIKHLFWCVQDKLKKEHLNVNTMK